MSSPLKHNLLQILDRATVSCAYAILFGNLYHFRLSYKFSSKQCSRHFIRFSFFLIFENQSVVSNVIHLIRRNILTRSLFSGTIIQLCVMQINLKDPITRNLLQLHTKFKHRTYLFYPSAIKNKCRRKSGKYYVSHKQCCVVQVCLCSFNNLEFGNNSSSSFMCHTSRTSISPIRMTTSHRINCCSVAFIEIKFQQKLCFNNQVLPSHSQRQHFKTDQVM